MQSIWKYQLLEQQTLQVPKGAKFLTAATQKYEPHVWALVDSDEPVLEPRTIVVVGTGHSLETTDGWSYIGTCYNVANLGLVFHVFEVTK